MGVAALFETLEKWFESIFWDLKLDYSQFIAFGKASTTLKLCNKVVQKYWPFHEKFIYLW